MPYVISILKRTASRALAFLLAMVLLLGVVPDSHALVICLGSDGHVAIERAHSLGCADACADAAQPHHAVRLNAAGADEEQCGSCVDIPLAPAIPDARKPLLPGQPFRLRQALATVPSPFAGTALGAPEAHPTLQAPVDAAVLLLRPVILLR